MYRLLIADDDVQQLGIRKLLLEAAGHQVAVAEDAPEARRLLQELRPDVLVMDLRLPKLKDGLSLIRCVAEQRLAAKIIVLSGWFEELPLGPDSFNSKSGTATGPRTGCPNSVSGVPGCCDSLRRSHSSNSSTKA